MASILIQNATLIDGLGGDPIPDGAVLIENDKISAVGPKASISAPANAEIIDAQGGTILPGLIDAHVHVMMEMGVPTDTMMMQPFSYQFYKAPVHMRKTVDAGITTVRDAGGADLGIKKAVEDGLVVGPRLMICTGTLSITGGHSDGWMPSGANRRLFSEYPGMPSGIVDGVEEVRKKVREMLRAGAEVIKVMATGGVLSPTDHPEFTQFSPEELAVIVQEGQFRRGVKVMAHAQGTEGIKNAVRAGIHSIEHGIYLDDEALELMLENGTYLVPTLLAPVAVVEMGEETGSIPEFGLRKAKEVIDIHKASIAKAYKAGVKIAMGTDAGVMPHGINLRELGLMCEIGMTPMESIVATTKTAAECMGWDDRVGTLEVGKLADVTIASTDPIADIRSLEDQNNITVVMQGGKVLKNLL